MSPYDCRRGGRAVIRALRLSPRESRCTKGEPNILSPALLESWSPLGTERFAPEDEGEDDEGGMMVSLAPNLTCFVLVCAEVDAGFDDKNVESSVRLSVIGYGGGISQFEASF